jgi:hypothetical protein
VTNEEVEVVAEELAKAGGLSWYPGRTQGALLRPVSERYRDRAGMAIAALERFRAGTQAPGGPQSCSSQMTLANKDQKPLAPDTLQIGSIVVYRPPGNGGQCRAGLRNWRRGVPIWCPAPGRRSDGSSWTLPAPHLIEGPSKRDRTLDQSIHSQFIGCRLANSCKILRLETWMRCYFHLVNSHEALIDDEGVEVADLESAKVQALMAIRELRRDSGGVIDDWSGWHLQIVCPEGTVLHAIPLDGTLH